MNKDNFIKLVETQSDAVFRYILRCTNERETAHDIVQESFEKIWIKRDEIHDETAKAYLFQTATNIMRNVFAKHKIQRQYAQNAIFTAQKSWNNTAHLDEKELLEKTFQTLADEQKQILLLRDYEGYSYAEIAEIMQFSEAQVKVYLFRSRVKLKNAITKIEAL